MRQSPLETAKYWIDLNCDQNGLIKKFKDEHTGMYNRY